MRAIDMKDIKVLMIFSMILGFFLIFAMVVINSPKIKEKTDDCVIVKGTWLKQELKPNLHYSFVVQGNVYNYHAQKEFRLRDDLNIGDDIRIKFCWCDGINGFLTKGIELEKEK